MEQSWDVSVLTELRRFLDDLPHRWVQASNRALSHADAIPPGAAQSNRASSRSGSKVSDLLPVRSKLLELLHSTSAVDSSVVAAGLQQLSSALPCDLSIALAAQWEFASGDCSAACAKAERLLGSDPRNAADLYARHVAHTVLGLAAHAEERHEAAWWHLWESLPTVMSAAKLGCLPCVELRLAEAIEGTFADGRTGAWMLQGAKVAVIFAPSLRAMARRVTRGIPPTSFPRTYRRDARVCLAVEGSSHWRSIPNEALLLLFASACDASFSTDRAVVGEDLADEDPAQLLEGLATSVLTRATTRRPRLQGVRGAGRKTCEYAVLRAAMTSRLVIRPPDHSVLSDIAGFFVRRDFADALMSLALLRSRSPRDALEALLTAQATTAWSTAPVPICTAAEVERSWMRAIELLEPSAAAAARADAAFALASATRWGAARRLLPEDARAPREPIEYRAGFVRQIASGMTRLAENDVDGALSALHAATSTAPPHAVFSTPPLALANDLLAMGYTAEVTAFLARSVAWSSEAPSLHELARNVESGKVSSLPVDAWPISREPPHARLTTTRYVK